MSLNPQLYPPIPPVQGDGPRPFWSVIVPAYKPEYLALALSSVMNQDPGPAEMEILVLDDCSPHALEPIVRQVCGQHATFIRQPTNLGTYANENAGLLMARGIWIHILNDDDYVLPGFYSTFAGSLKDRPEKIGAAACRQSNVDTAGRELRHQPILRDTPGIIENFIGIVGIANPIHPIGTIIRRSTYEHLGGYYLKLNFCADWEFNKRAAVFYDWWYEPRLMACYRHHETSVTHEGRMTGDQIRDMGRCIEMSEAYFPLDQKRRLVERSREAYRAAALRVATKSLRSGAIDAAIRQIQAGLEINRSPKMLEQLVTLLSEPAASPLRELLPQFFKLINVSKSDEKKDER